MSKILGVLLLCATVTAQSAELKKVVGQVFPKVNVKNAVSGEVIDLSQVLTKNETKGAVVFFTSYKCPYAIGYEERTNKVAVKYSATVPFLALNANAASEDTASQAAYAKEKGFKFSVAIDEGSKIAKEIGAGNTPEYYLIDKAGKIVYHGPLDDSFDAPYVQQEYLTNAIEAVLAGKPVPEKDQEPPLTKSCNIKFLDADKSAGPQTPPPKDTEKTGGHNHQMKP